MAATVMQPADTGRVGISALGIRDFRNLARVDLPLPADGVAVIGDNGHGKTNLLEAIAYFAVLRSMRGVRDRDLVRFGAAAFSLSVDAAGGAAAATAAGPVRVTIGFESGGTRAGAAVRKQVAVDGVPVRRLSDAFGAVPSVVIAPRDVLLVSGAPGERRRYLDVLLAMTDRRYLLALQQYRAALLRRNATLRLAAQRPGERADELSAWEESLAQAGAVIRAARQRWLREQRERIAAICAAIGEALPVQVRYSARADVTLPEGGSAEAEQAAWREELLEALRRDRARDARRLVTHAGPHRDDLSISLGGHALRVVGSAGQQRTVAIALRLAARETIRAATGRLPLMLLDDPFAELDATRTARILELLSDGNAAGVGQLVLAVPRAADLPAAFARLPRLGIRNGVIES